MRRYIKFFVLSFLAILILWFFGRSLNWTEVWQSLQKAEVGQVLLATSIVCLGYLLRAFRWQTLLSPITESSLRELFATTTVGFAAVFLFGRAGEVVRPLWLPLRDQRVRPSAALVTIGVERIFDLITIVSIFALNLLWFRAPAGREAEFVIVNRTGFLMLALMLVGIVGLILFQHFSEPILKKLETICNRLPLPKRLNQLVLSLFQQLAASLQVLRNPKELALTVFWTALLWLSIALPTWLILTAFDLPLGFSDALFVMGAASLGSLVPTPGGAAGAFHAATAGAIVSLSVNREDAAAVAIVMHLVYFAPALLFGFYYFVRGDISWTRLRSLVVAEEKPTEGALPQPQLQKLRMENSELRNAES